MVCSSLISLCLLLSERTSGVFPVIFIMSCSWSNIKIKLFLKLSLVIHLVQMFSWHIMSIWYLLCLHFSAPAIIQLSRKRNQMKVSTIDGKELRMVRIGTHLNLWEACHHSTLDAAVVLNKYYSALAFLKHYWLKGTILTGCFFPLGLPLKH